MALRRTYAHGMFDPMFNPNPSLIFGLPTGLIPLALGIVGSAIGILWIRRIVEPDPETRIFAVYTRDRSRQRTALLAGLALAAVAIGLVVYLKA